MGRRKKNQVLTYEQKLALLRYCEKYGSKGVYDEEKCCGTCKYFDVWVLDLQGVCRYDDTGTDTNSNEGTKCSHYVKL